MMYHYYQTHYKMHNNINTHVHVKKNHVICKLHYPLLLMYETKILKPFQINEKLFIFTAIPPHISKQNISIFKKFKRK
jgi:hypothetical protein